LIILSRVNGGYKDGNSHIPAAQLEKERKESQAKLVRLSSNNDASASGATSRHISD
jgi:hypothetical protein